MPRILIVEDSPTMRSLLTSSLEELEGAVKIVEVASAESRLPSLTFTVIELSLGKPTAAAFAAIVFGATLGFLLSVIRRRERRAEDLSLRAQASREPHGADRLLRRAASGTGVRSDSRTDGFTANVVCGVPPRITR